MSGLVLVAFLALGQTPDPVQRSYKAERIALVVASAADVVTTRIGIIKGGREGNPLLVKVVGRQPSTLKLVAVKAAAFGIAEATSRFLRKHGEHGQARAVYWIMAAASAFAAGLNLQWVWK